MAFPEKTERNELIYFQYIGPKGEGLSYRAIQRYHNLKSVKSVYRIVDRMRRRFPDSKTFVHSYRRKHGK